MELNIPENSNMYVIPDIHGCYNTLKKLIEDNIGLNKDDYIFFLGDYIDKGPYSSKVLDYILFLKENNYKIYLLMGNHEKFLLDAYNEYDPNTFRLYVEKLCKSINLLTSDNKIRQEYYELLNSLNLYFEINNKFILVHAGVNFLKDKPYEDINTILTGIVVLPENLPFEKTIIHGHFINEFENLIKSIEKKEKIIPLDNGCYINKPHRFYNYEKYGNLFCLNLKNFNYQFQKNID